MSTFIYNHVAHLTDVATVTATETKGDTERKLRTCNWFAFERITLIPLLGPGVQFPRVKDETAR